MAASARLALWRRFALWFCLNLTIFVACYLNYRLQPKHRYLYRTLSVGLCLSRAAAMVINFNLLLVWLPMCKYALTKLALLANRSLRIRDSRCRELALRLAPADPKLAAPRQKQKLAELAERLKLAAKSASLRLRLAANALERRALAAFLVAADHCTALHTTCASTIALASVVHTVAHLTNVISFSNNFDPLLGELNMAEFRGQNPLQLLISVPGLTGILMVLILALMSLSSTNLIRSSSFDLFQLFHRLSLIFVVLLALHPSSHVLKEQSNVERHDPDLCYARLQANLSAAAQPAGRAAETRRQASGDLTPPRQQQQQQQQIGKTNGSRAATPERQCADERPLFVAQSSICCYVLALGLSCYLLDLLLRRWRRSRSPIQLLSVRLDLEGNLIELVMSANHRRFSGWLPGQFVYLNCPQISSLEWHPFTISSMSEAAREFTLHIKTGGDWTRRLRAELESRSPPGAEARGLDRKLELVRDAGASPTGGRSVLPTLDCLNSKTGELEVRCTRAVALESQERAAAREREAPGSCDLGADLKLYVDGPFHSPFERLLDQQVAVCIASGVGWTAFSSVFQCLAGRLEARAWTAAPVAAESAPSPPRRHLHLVVVVASVEQLAPFHRLALDYFAGTRGRRPEEPVREICAYVTRAHQQDEEVREFCRQQRGHLRAETDGALLLNDSFSVRFGRPQLELYLARLRSVYARHRKLAVYCCGSGQVKRTVRGACLRLNRCASSPQFAYHEENF